MRRGSASERRGFTLLEVALVVVLALVVTAGVVVAYNGNKDQAAGALARKRIQMGQTVVEEFAAANHAYPVSGAGQFAATWARTHPDEAAVSPWGGAPGSAQGAVEDAPFADGTADPATAPDKTASAAVDPTRHGNLHYVSVDGNRYVKVSTRYTGEAKTLHGYVVSIYDSAGNPWFDVGGGTK